MFFADIITSRSTHTSSKSATNFAGMSPIDVEKELLKIKRRMGGFYTKGFYNDALACATELESKVSNIMGTKNVVYASALNNVALMNKLLGSNDVAMAKYTEALHIYEDIVGKRHPSYASTLSNLGRLWSVHGVMFF